MLAKSDDDCNLAASPVFYTIFYDVVVQSTKLGIVTH